MEFYPGAASLSDLVNGSLGAGIVPMPRTIRGISNVENAGIVNLPIGVMTDIVTNCRVSNCLTNDIALVFGRAGITKGGVLGNTELTIQSDGGAAMNVDPGGPWPRFLWPSQPAASGIDVPVMAVCTLLADGNFQCRLRGQSNGSAGSVAATAAGLWAVVYAYS